MSRCAWWSIRPRAAVGSCGPWPRPPRRWTAPADAVAEAGGSMALIPAGRGNDLARELGLPPSPAAAATAILDGEKASLDLLGLSIPGQPEEIAVLSAYLGLPSVAGEIANRSRLIRGPATYPVAALRSLARWRPVSFRVHLTGGLR